MVRDAVRSLRIIALPMAESKFYLPDSTMQHCSPNRTLTAGRWFTIISDYLALKRSSQCQPMFPHSSIKVISGAFTLSIRLLACMGKTSFGDHFETVNLKTRSPSRSGKWTYYFLFSKNILRNMAVPTRRNVGTAQIGQAAV